MLRCGRRHHWPAGGAAFRDRANLHRSQIRNCFHIQTTDAPYPRPRPAAGMDRFLVPGSPSLSLGHGLRSGPLSTSSQPWFTLAVPKCPRLGMLHTSSFRLAGVPCRRESRPLFLGALSAQSRSLSIWRRPEAPAPGLPLKTYLRRQLCPALPRHPSAYVYPPTALDLDRTARLERRQFSRSGNSKRLVTNRIGSGTYHFRQRFYGRDRGDLSCVAGA